MRPAGTRPDGKFVYNCAGGAILALFPKPSGTKADHTAVSFQVPDIDAAIRDLKRSGVVFEDYDLPGLKTVDHVCVLGAEKAAWFKDTEGNILCIHEGLLS
jgi:predicted enzyme related to lactoylglutathione lyase